MKKILLWLLLGLSFYAAGAYAMEAPTTISKEALAEMMKNASREGAKQAIYDTQESALWHYTKKGVFYGGIAIGVYFGVRKILGMPSMAHVREKVNTHVTNARSYITSVFGGISQSLKNIGIKVTNLHNRAQRTTTTLNSLADDFERQELDLQEINQQVTNLIGFAQASQKTDEELGETLNRLIAAICRNQRVRSAIVRNIERRLTAIDLDEDTREALGSLKETINGFQNITVY